MLSRARWPVGTRCSNPSLAVWGEEENLANIRFCGSYIELLRVRDDNQDRDAVYIYMPTAQRHMMVSCCAAAAAKITY